MRIGFGYDVHRLVLGRKLILGGVDIPFEKGLAGHSDADALCHAIGDALLGSAALGDIGTHFPDNDPRYKDISSLLLLKQIKGILEEKRFRILSIDSTVVMERPKIADKTLQMRENIAKVLNLDIDQVSVKATTTEGLGFLGRGEGVACYAVALTQKV